MEAVIDNLKEVFIEEYSISVGKNPDRIFKRCAELCNKYVLDAEDFAGTWLAFAATKSIMEMEERMLDEFEKQELSSRKEVVDKPTISISDLKMKTATAGKIEVYGDTSYADVDSDMEVENDDILQAYGVQPSATGTPKVDKKPTSLRFKSHVSDTPNKGDFSPAGYSPAVQAKSVSYGARTKAGDTVLRFKCKDSEYWNEVSTENDQPVKIIPVLPSNSLMKADYKYMYQKTTDLASTLNSVIISIGDDMLKEDEKEIQDLRVSSVEDCWYLGRIRNDEGRLSQNSTFFEGDLEISDGHIVFLDMSGAEEYRLFPGQVVLVKGKNELGNCLRVTEVVVPPALPLPKVTSNQTRPINVIVAAGPFTPSDSLMYEPLMDFLEVIKRDKPDLCVLAGPFIDPFHPLIAGGELADTFEKVFEDLVEKISKAISNIRTQVVLISSSKDACHHAVYPTPPYELLNKKREKITVLPDPAMLEVAGITMGFTTMDILKHLANTEVSKTTITDRMGGLSKLILSQRNFYPLYPPDESVPLDIQLWSKNCKFTKTPHVLVLPSDLRYFIKEVDGTIVMNPERLTKGKSGGSYARFQVKLPESADTEIQSIADFCSGEMIKI